jgi:hypothetical protein
MVSLPNVSDNETERRSFVIRLLPEVADALAETQQKLADFYKVTDDQVD